MKKLESFIKRKGMTYKLIKRNDFKAIYSVGNYGYEWFLIKKQKAGESVIGGVKVKFEAKELFPNDNDFGKTAWTGVDKESCLARYELLTKNAKFSIHENRRRTIGTKTAQSTTKILSLILALILTIPVFGQDYRQEANTQAWEWDQIIREYERVDQMVKDKLCYNVKTRTVLSWDENLKEWVETQEPMSDKEFYKDEHRWKKEDESLSEYLKNNSIPVE